MMNTLREEIDKKINRIDPYPPMIDQVIDICIHVFEKRIDKMISNTTSTKGMDIPNSFHSLGYTTALSRVKEMLK